ncbi:transcription factor IIIA-like [Dunckerocampus dactyliophorus]|uniref:transcription factor IIIA-like n=1 Tax=Dunckerocampus dactyliophorus TaxID=161453 RepID=UPI0024064EAA|nr:transcription factor IIIA-like [Dunckerocampus dactyliophorus]
MEGNVEPHKRFICSFAGCAAAYNKQWKLDAHLCKHTGVKPHKCPHDGCDKDFCSPYHLARHQLSHSGLHPFPCTVEGCAQAFTTNSNRARHVTRVHSGEAKRYMCKVDGCNLEFKKNKQLKSHMSEQHTHTPAYQCTHDGCTMRFTFPSRLKRHMKVHRGYPCTQESCIFTGSTWTEYLKHRREQHRPALSCEQCSKVFKDSWFLEQHQRVHSDTRLVYRCPREACERSFTTIFNLQSHIQAFHEELQPFTCGHPGCGKTFAMKQSLRRHGVVHDPDRKKMPRPKRSLASRLSGCSDKMVVLCEKSPVKQDASGPVELVSLLQDTSLMGRPTVDSQELTVALTSPLTL